METVAQNLYEHHYLHGGDVESSPDRVIAALDEVATSHSDWDIGARLGVVAQEQPLRAPRPSISVRL